MSSAIGGGFFGGLDIETIVQALIDAQRGPIRRAEVEIDRLQARSRAVSDVRGALSTLDGARRQALSAQALAAQVAASSDETVFTATASGSADVGLHEIQVEELARADRHRSQAYADRDTTPVGQGVLTFTVDGATTSVTVDDSNDTLQGVMDAINADPDSGARASIVNDGTGDILVLASRETGAASDIVFEENTTDLVFTQTQGAQDAEIVLDGITIQDPSNTITSALRGVTIQLRAAAPGDVLTLEVSADAEQVEESVRSFVDAFNNALATLDRVSRADTSGGRNSGPLVGDPAIRAIKADLLATVSSPNSPSDPDGYSLLAEVGVSLAEGGRLSLDTARLRERLDENPRAVVDLFQKRGVATDAGVGYVTSTSATQAGTYAVNITTLAERATLQGDNVIDASGLLQDETLTITVGGTEVEVSLATGDDADAVADAINDALGDREVDAVAENDGGRIVIRTSAYGAAAEVAVRSSVGSIAGSVGFDTTDRTDEGADVAGTIGGAAATGQGQVLAAADGTAAEGLRVAITRTTTGDAGDLTFRLGVSEKLARAVDRAIDRQDGRLQPMKDGLDRQVRQRQTRIERMEEILAQRADALRRKFSAAQQALSQLQSMQAQLSAR
jgi:flagellar hook-associated protein 2